MTTITARGWPGLINYKPPAPIKSTWKSNGVPSAARALGLRSYDLWLHLDLPFVQAYSGSVQLEGLHMGSEDERADWCNPLGTVATHPYGLWRAYQPNVAIVGYDLGYQLGQLAEYWQTTRTGAHRIFPYGWGKRSDSGKTVGGVSPHRPPLLMRPRTKGWHVQFALPKSGPPGKYGQWRNGQPFLGNFIDLQSVEHALGA